MGDAGVVDEDGGCGAEVLVDGGRGGVDVGRGGDVAAVVADAAGCC